MIRSLPLRVLTRTLNAWASGKTTAIRIADPKLTWSGAALHSRSIRQARFLILLHSAPDVKPLVAVVASIRIE